MLSPPFPILPYSSLPFQPSYLPTFLLSYFPTCLRSYFPTRQVRALLAGLSERALERWQIVSQPGGEWDQVIRQSDAQTIIDQVVQIVSHETR